MKLMNRMTTCLLLIVGLMALPMQVAFAEEGSGSSGSTQTVSPPGGDASGLKDAGTMPAPPKSSWTGPSPTANDVVDLAGDMDNFGYGIGNGVPCAFYDLSGPADLGVFDRELSGGDPVDVWSHTYTIPVGVTVSSVLIEIPEIFSDFNGSTIEIDGTVYPFVVNGASRCGPPIVQTFFFSGGSAAFAADGVVNMTFRENGDDIAMDYSRLIINPSGAVSSADVMVSQTASPNPASANSPMVFSVLVTNNGPDTATGVVLTDTLPAATFNSATAGQGSCGAPSGGVLTCALGSLASGASTTVDINVTPTTAGSVTNVADVSANESDPDTSNNSSSLEVQVLDADLWLTMTDIADPVPAGSDIGYDLSVINNGPGPSYNVVLTVNLPATTSFDGASGGSCSAIGLVVTCTRSSIAAYTSWDLIVYAFVPANTPRGTIMTGNASVTALTPDPDPYNNSDSEETLISILADFLIRSFGGPSRVASGGSTFSVVAENWGPSQIPFGEIQVDLPAGMTMLSAAGGRCRITARQAFCVSPGAMAPWSSFTMTFSARGTAGGRYTMVARAVTTVPDPNGMNNWAQKQVMA